MTRRTIPHPNRFERAARDATAATEWAWTDDRWPRRVTVPIIGALALFAWAALGVLGAVIAGWL